jgi:hypothetical protein
VEQDLRFGWPTGVTEQATRMRVLWTWSCVAALSVWLRGVGTDLLVLHPLPP